MDTLAFLHQYSDWGILALRITIAAVFIIHGPPKLMNPQMGTGMGFSTGFFLLLGLGETAGSISVFFGFLTQIGAAILAIVMLGALYYKTTIWNVPFTSMEKTGWEFDFVLLAAAIALILGGAGGISLDRMMFDL